MCLVCTTLCTTPRPRPLPSRAPPWLRPGAPLEPLEPLLRSYPGGLRPYPGGGYKGDGYRDGYQDGYRAAGEMILWCSASIKKPHSLFIVSQRIPSGVW